MTVKLLLTESSKEITDITHPSICGFTTNLRLFVMLLITLLLPLAVHANDLFDYRMQLAKQGSSEAQFKVGEMYETGFGVEQDKKEAIYWTTRSANQKHETAQFKLVYWDLEKQRQNGKNNTKFEELSKKAKQGNAQAQYYLGKMYAHGVGIEKDSDVAIDWLNKAASVGVLNAELELASIIKEKQSEVLKERRFNSDPCSDKTARFLSTCR
jgi:TPR repeat protein